MKISIIIPTLNEAAHIQESIERAQKAIPHEVIVVDGGSTDQTVQIARRCKCLVLEGQPGRAVQQNCGAEQATGDVLLFLHADSWLNLKSLEQIRTAIVNPKISAGAFQQRIEADGFLFRLLEFGNALRVRCLKLPYGDQGIFVRKDLFVEMGGFPVVRLMEDLLLMRKLRRKTRVVLLPGPIHTSARRWRKHGVIGQTLRNWSLLTAEKLGVAPDRLAKFYDPHWKNNDREENPAATQ